MSCPGWPTSLMKSLRRASRQAHSFSDSSDGCSSLCRHFIVTPPRDSFERHVLDEASCLIKLHHRNCAVPRACHSYGIRKPEYLWLQSTKCGNLLACSRTMQAGSVMQQAGSKPCRWSRNLQNIGFQRGGMQEHR
jgi:hypothetical protein